MGEREVYMKERMIVRINWTKRERAGTEIE
jgi:hypothetical protein